MIGKVRWILKFVRKNGMRCLILHIFFAFIHIEERDYSWWRKKQRPKKRELKKQKKVDFQNEPTISILVPIQCTNLKNVIKMVESVQNQTYRKWELCLAEGSGGKKAEDRFLDRYVKKDSRIKLITSKKPLSVPENINQALKIASGDFLTLIEAEDLLERHTLFECVKIINKYPKVDILYTDEDKVSKNGKTYFSPHFKSDYNLDLLCSMNYIGSLFIVKSEIQKQVGMFSDDFSDEYEYDFILRCIEKSDCIRHIPKVLYHKRVNQKEIKNSNEIEKVVKMHLERCQRNCSVNIRNDIKVCKVKYFLSKEPLVSVIIPSKDHITDLERCIRSLYEISEYSNIEIIIIENGSIQKKTFSYYTSLLNRYENIKIVTWNENKEFNYSALNNFGVKSAIGEYLLFLNNDTRIMNKSCLSEMVTHAARKEVGAVGAKLYYPDGTIQHAGVIVGMGGIAGHAFCGEKHNAIGYFSRIQCTQNYSAVTAACMMMSKALFEEVGGFDEKLKVAFNDVDLCMKIRKKGKLIVYTPYAELYHYESKSRGGEDTEEKLLRFYREVHYFEKKWEQELKAGDPYYNMNLTLEKNDFSLRIV